MSVNHKIVYVPLSNDPNGNKLIYPIYLPIVVDEPDVLYSTGSLSKRDFLNTKRIYHLSAGEDRESGDLANRYSGFPIAPIIAALAPIVIPGAIKAVKNIVSKFKSSGALSDDAAEMLESDIISAIENDSNENVAEDTVEEIEDTTNESGYIPTNPNIRTLKQLQSLYDKYK